VAEHIGGRQNHERVIWSLTNLEMFMRTFKLSQCEQFEGNVVRFARGR